LQPQLQGAALSTKQDKPTVFIVQVLLPVHQGRNAGVEEARMKSPKHFTLFHVHPLGAIERFHC
jgi:hypothetical protein